MVRAAQQSRPEERGVPIQAAGPEPGPQSLPTDHVADYIAELSDELATLARGARMKFVAHLLELVHHEAKGLVVQGRASKRKP